MSKFFEALERAERERALRENRPSAVAASAETEATEVSARRTEGLPTSVSDRVPSGFRDNEAVAPATELTDDGADEHLVSLLRPASAEAEQYRVLRHLVEQLRASAELAVLAVSSPAAGDGKTVTAINLAGALAQSPAARVLLIDADLRRSSIARQLGHAVAGQRGFVEAILDPALGLEAVARPCRPFNLSVVHSGGGSGTPYEVLRSPRLGALFQAARAQYSHVIVDTPPLVAFPDARVMGAWIDGFLLVVGAHKTPRKLLEEALNAVDPAKLVGLVFNGDARSLSRYDRSPYRRDGGRRLHVPDNGRQPGWWRRALGRIGRA